MPDILHGWTTTGLRGLASLLFGVGALLFPVVSVINLIALFGAYALADGTLALAAARAGTRGAALKGFFVGEGLVGIGAGLVTFPLLPLWGIALPRLVGVWVLGTGVLRLGQAIRLRQYGHGSWLLALAGLTSLPVGYFLLVTPVQNELALALIRLIGAYAVGQGIILLVVSGRLQEPEGHRPA
ncbi:MAG: HdeD family acid-resistance protein [Chloroflexota bacterium]|nr:MAG: HdeD family acid-resistance protein [Chloroflexota bacterium]